MTGFYMKPNTELNWVNYQMSIFTTALFNIKKPPVKFLVIYPHKYLTNSYI